MIPSDRIRAVPDNSHTYILPTTETSSSKNPVNVPESVLDLLLPVILIEIAIVVPPALTRELCDVADNDCLSVVAEIAVFLSCSLLIDVSERRHLERLFGLAFDRFRRSWSAEYGFTLWSS